MIKVVIVDDSATARASLRMGLAVAEDIVVVGETARGEDAVDLVLETQPDLVLMDVHLPGRNGIEVTRSLMTRAPRPVVIVTGITPDSPELIYQAMQAGALEVLAKLPSPTHREYPVRCQRLVRVLRNLSKVPVVTHFDRASVERVPTPARSRSDGRAPRRSDPAGPPQLVVIGASTGGPPLLKDILSALPAPFGLPIVVVQHITAGFGVGFGQWLSDVTGHRVVLVERTQPMQSGCVYLASDDQQLELRGPERLSSYADPAALIRPCIDVLFESAARWVGSGVVAVLLTGMGRDGARGLSALRKAGAQTVAQSPETCVVGSMPQAAIADGSARLVLPPAGIIDHLRNLPPARSARRSDGRE
jgi:two-component system, chemotaxis family, protein-glutamate methylesterase/glutaminase